MGKLGSPARSRSSRVAAPPAPGGPHEPAESYKEEPGRACSSAGCASLPESQDRCTLFTAEAPWRSAPPPPGQPARPSAQPPPPWRSAPPPPPGPTHSQPTAAARVTAPMARSRVVPPVPMRKAPPPPRPSSPERKWCFAFCENPPPLQSPPQPAPAAVPSPKCGDCVSARVPTAESVHTLAPADLDSDLDPACAGPAPTLLPPVPPPPQLPDLNAGRSSPRSGGEFKAPPAKSKPPPTVPQQFKAPLANSKPPPTVLQPGLSSPWALSGTSSKPAAAPTSFLAPEIEPAGQLEPLAKSKPPPTVHQPGPSYPWALSLSGTSSKPTATSTSFLAPEIDPAGQLEPLAKSKPPPTVLQPGPLYPWALSGSSSKPAAMSKSFLAPEIEPAGQPEAEPSPPLSTVSRAFEFSVPSLPFTSHAEVRQTLPPQSSPSPHEAMLQSVAKLLEDEADDTGVGAPPCPEDTQVDDHTAAHGQAPFRESKKVAMRAVDWMRPEAQVECPEEHGDKQDPSDSASVVYSTLTADAPEFVPYAEQEQSGSLLDGAWRDVCGEVGTIKGSILHWAHPADDTEEATKLELDGDIVRMVFLDEVMIGCLDGDAMQLKWDSGDRWWRNFQIPC